MENFRDLVSGQDTCDDGSANYRNPLGRFVDHLYRDRSQQQQEWREAPGELNTKHEERLNTHTHDAQEHVERFFNHFDEGPMKSHDPLGTFNDGLNFDEFENFMHGGPSELGEIEGFDRLKISNEVPPDFLKFYIKSFIDSARSQQTFRPMHLPDLGLSDTDKMKIRDRSGILARHMYPNQSEDFVESQLHTFLHSIDQQQQVGPHMRNNDMVDEFLSTSTSRTGRYHDDGPDQMEKYFRESVQANDMAREFEQYRNEQDFEQIYRESNATQQWVDEFEGVRPIERLDNIQSLTQSITQIQDPKLQKTNFMKFMTRLSKGELEFVDNGVVEKKAEDNWADEFSTEYPQSREIDEQWANEFQEKYGHEWLQDYESQLSEDQEEWLKEYNVFGGGTTSRDYEFTDASKNPYMTHPQPFEKGIELFNDGKISESILALEAELQNNPGNSACWQYLGQAHAENDKDAQAIAALNKAVEADPQNRSALMALAVSYTNDLYRDQALDTLKSWIESHPQYKAIKFDMPAFEGGYSFELYHSAIANMFMEAARMRPEDPDYDVQTALGLLFNLSLDYEKAVDCFKAAISVRPDDYLLWNKLGATLANSSRSEEALGCYFKALEIKPSYVRARANLGISFMALKQYDRAAQYFLGALSMHPEARHIWTNLQMVFMSMGRDDLIEKSVQNNVEAFRGEFEF